MTNRAVDEAINANSLSYSSPPAKELTLAEKVRHHVSKMNFTTPRSYNRRVGGFRSKLSESRATSTRSNFNKIAFIRAASSISIYQCWLYRNSFETFLQNQLTHYKFLKKENKALYTKESKKDITGLWCTYMCEKASLCWSGC